MSAARGRETEGGGILNVSEGNGVLNSKETVDGENGGKDNKSVEIYVVE